MKVKDSSVQLELHPTLTDFLIYADKVYRNWEDELVITSGSEDASKHGFTSLHYAKPGCAVDVRIWDEIHNGRGKVPDAEVQHRVLTKEAALYCETHKMPTNWIEVILEGDHIHIEFQPKRRA